MKAVILSALALSLAACHAPKPFLDTPLAIAPPKSIGDSGCPATLDPVCVVYENNGHRMQQTFGNDCAVCIAPEFIVSRRRGACER